MKTLIIALALGMSLTGFAQETTKVTNKANTEKLTPQQRQEKHLAHLTKELKLDTKQKEAVGKMLAEKSDKAQNLKSQKADRRQNGQKLTPDEKEVLKAKMKAEKEDTEIRMKAILTADQYAKWQTLREEKKEKIIAKKS